MTTDAESRATTATADCMKDETMARIRPTPASMSSVKPIIAKRSEANPAKDNPATIDSLVACLGISPNPAIRPAAKRSAKAAAPASPEFSKKLTEVLVEVSTVSEYFA